jgi:HlyD family secretion protein
MQLASLCRAAAAIALGALALAGCASRAEPHGGAYQGVVEFEERAIAAEVPGRLVEVALVRGADVTVGAAVARLDATLAEASRSARAAEVEAASARLALLVAGTRREDLDSMVAQIRAARANEKLLQVELDRARRLVEQSATPQATVDQYAGQVERAGAERQSLEEKLAALRHGARPEEIRAAEAGVEAAQAVLAVEDGRIAQYTVHAPVSGTILDLLHRSGEVVGAGVPIATIADTAHPYVDIFVPEDQLAGLVVGRHAQIDSDDNSRVTGAIEDIARAAEFTPKFLFSERERHNLVIRVRVRIDDGGRVLHAGEPAFVTFTDGVTAPSAAAAPAPSAPASDGAAPSAPAGAPATTAP